MRRKAREIYSLAPFYMRLVDCFFYYSKEYCGIFNAFSLFSGYKELCEKNFLSVFMQAISKKESLATIEYSAQN